MKLNFIIRRAVVQAPVNARSNVRSIVPPGERALLGTQIQHYPQDFWDEDPELRTFEQQPNDEQCVAYRKQKWCDGDVMKSTEKNPKEYLYMQGMHWINPDNDVRNRQYWYDHTIRGNINTVWRPENENTVLRFNQEMPFMAFSPADIHHEVDYESEDADVEIVTPREMMHNRTVMSWWWRAIMWGTFGFIVCIYFPWITVKLVDSTMLRNAEGAANFDQEELTLMSFAKTPEGKKLVELGLLESCPYDINEKGEKVSYL
mmetsp:Transcript_49097/g.56439  ORF Transcript_49097/g.56439 Transcript_49097/m.56439 type:complete len:260 (+) Transcript_49097:116-895(+)|eukprot:CAMPEP_0115005520 /NCGR_PEP_ID=MMETSP0216-20121206/19924_1 /TAXON_ID=223996 /ORGANISM="Protocruzia adherens, Strain Boccale" /LENGTH=259 /DNA_ID=CAMNT_0002371869 /DNA_START=109 /DNA_END=888 /DNA_ORIENTATION=-